MKAEELVEMLEERPFVPLRLHMSNGRSHDIRHPKLAIIGENVVAIGVETEESARPRLRFVSIAHINEVEPVNGSVHSD